MMLMVEFFCFTTPKEKLIFCFSFLLQLKGRDKMHGWSYSVLEYLNFWSFWLVSFRKFSDFLCNGFEIKVMISWKHLFLQYILHWGKICHFLSNFWVRVFRFGLKAVLWVASNLSSLWTAQWTLIASRWVLDGPYLYRNMKIELSYF